MWVIFMTFLSFLSGLSQTLAQLLLVTFFTSRYLCALKKYSALTNPGQFQQLKVNN